MQILKEDFYVSYTIKGGLIKSSASGNFNGNDYDPSVRISCTNILEVENEKTKNVDETEQKLIFKIVCPDNITAGLVAKAIKAKLKISAITLSGGLPNDTKVVSVITPYDTFLADNLPITVSEFNEKISKKDK